MRKFFLLLLAGALLWPAAVISQPLGSCANPISVLDFLKSAETFEFDTSIGQNDRIVSCDGEDASGPDLVLWFEGMLVAGILEWEADFDAVVYELHGCNQQCASDTKEGSLYFDSGYKWDVINDRPYGEVVRIVIDGLDGSSGAVRLRFVEGGSHVPTLERTWGSIKRTYR